MYVPLGTAGDARCWRIVLIFVLSTQFENNHDETSLFNLYICEEQD